MEQTMGIDPMVLIGRGFGIDEPRRDQIFYSSGGLRSAIAGAAIGVATYVAVAPSTVRTLYVDRVVTVSVSVPVSAASSAEPIIRYSSLPVVSEASAPRAAAATGSATAARGRDTDLAAERSLLDAARTALRRGDGAGALDAVNRHRRQLPSSQLGEEREIIGIHGLVGSGGSAEARAAAQQFVQRRPQSTIRPALEQIIGSEP